MAKVTDPELIAKLNASAAQQMTPELSARLDQMAAQQRVASQPQKQYEWEKPNAFMEGMTGLDKFRAGMGKGMTDVVRGVGQLVGINSTEDIDEAKKYDAALMETGAGTAGSIVGNIAASAPTMLIPGVNTTLGATLVGGGLGLAQPVATGDSRVLNTAVGGIGGGVGKKAMDILGGAFSPQVSKNLQLLDDEGVTTTIGQRVGSVAKAWEDLSQSNPWGLGRAITDRRQEGLESFNKAVLNRALKPLGDKLSREVPAGQSALKVTRKKLGDAYENLLPKLTGKMDDDITGEIGGITEALKMTVPKQERKLFEKVLKREFSKRIEPDGTITGKNLKKIESQLNIARDKFKVGDSYQQNVGDSLGEVQDSLRSMIARNNPESAKELQDINRGYAIFKRAQKAATASGAEEGVFTGAQLKNAVKSADKTKDKRAFSEGDALLQDLAQAAQDILPSSIPNSGTAERTIFQQGFDIPSAAMSQIYRLGLYNPVSRRAAQTLTTPRSSQLMQNIGDTFRVGRKGVVPVTGGLLDYMNQE